jgi:hypothetical protein
MKTIIRAKGHGGLGLGQRRLIVVVMVAASVIVDIISRISLVILIITVLAMLETWVAAMAWTAVGATVIFSKCFEFCSY